MVGSAIVRRLAREDCEIVATDQDAVDLRNQARTAAWVQALRPAAVFLAAAKVGGILANATYPADFLYDNLMIEANIIEACHRADVEKLLFLGSSCVYPKLAEQPIREEALLLARWSRPTNGTRSPRSPASNWPRPIANSTDATSSAPCRRIFTALATISTWLRAMFCRRSCAKRTRQSIVAIVEIVVWGSGAPRRELLHVDDCADACVYLMKTYSGLRPCQCRRRGRHLYSRPRAARLRHRRVHRFNHPRLLKAGRNAA